MADESSIVMAEVVVDDEVASPHGKPCPTCGAPVEPYDKFCPACGAVSEVDVPTAAVVQDRAKYFQCENCGAEVATDPDHLSYVCPFCDSTYVVEVTPDVARRQRPEFVIGFAITRERAQEIFRQWLKQRTMFCPNDLGSVQVEDKMMGVYLPFWAFTMQAKSGWSAQIGEYWYRTETYTTTDSKGKTVVKTRQVRETEWWNLDGQHHQYHSGFLVSGSKGLPQDQAERIKPFNLPALKRYEPYFLAGWLAEEHSVRREDAMKLCRQVFYQREQQLVADFLPGDTHRSLQVRTTFHDENSDLCLLPVYLLSYRYNDKLYRFMVNGQTGKSAGDKPVSTGKIVAWVGGAVTLVLLCVLLIWLLGSG